MTAESLRRAKCQGCGAPLLCQRVGHNAALDVTADAAPINPEREAAIRSPNRLTWCLVTRKWSPPELRWRCPPYATRCDHQVVADHHCTTRRPAPPAAAQPALF